MTTSMYLTLPVFLLLGMVLGLVRMPFPCAIAVIIAVAAISYI